LLTSGTYGPLGSGSSDSAALALSLGSKLQEKQARLGSTLYRQTWKVKDTPSGRRLLRLVVSGRRTNESGFTGWPTPKASTAGPDYAVLKRKETHGAGGLSIATAAVMAAWQTPKARDGVLTTSRTTGRPMHRTTHLQTQAIALLTEADPTLAAWPSPIVNDATGSTYCRDKAGAKYLKLPGATALTSWPTPATRDYRHANAKSYQERTGTKKGEQLNNAAVHLLAAWPTPVVRDHRNSKGDGSNPRDLPRTIPLAAWPTPKSTNGKNDLRTLSAALNELKRKGTANDLSVAALICGPARLTVSGELQTGSSAEMESGGQLNPEHSLWLMGLPVEWLLAAPESAPSPRYRKRKVESSQGTRHSGD
jgi:hypothetical protein